MSKSSESVLGFSEWRSKMMMCLESYLNFKLQNIMFQGRVYKLQTEKLILAMSGPKKR